MASPAHAEDADLRLEIRSGEIALATGGAPQTLTLAVINDGPSPVSSAVANIEAPLSARGVTIGGTSASCTPVNGPSSIACQLGAMNPGQTIDVTVQLVPPGAGAVQPGENVAENGNAWVSNPAGGDPNNGNDGGSFNVVLSAGDEGAPVSEVSGSVVDGSSGNPLEGATVEIKDSNGTVGTATTDSEGRFNYRAEPPLKAGRISIKASKDGYDTSRTTVNASGNINDVQLAVSQAVASTPSASPSSAPTTAAPQSPPPSAASTKGDESSVSLIVVVLISVVATAILTGGGLWIGLRRNRENDPATAGGPGPPMRPNFGDAPTVQLRLDGLGGGTQVMPPPGQPLSNPAVDTTQQIPQPDSTQLMPPGGPYLPTPSMVQYDETAPFGPGPTAQGFAAEAVAPIGLTQASAAPYAGGFAEAPQAAPFGQSPQAAPFGEPPRAAPFGQAPQATSFGEPPHAAPFGQAPHAPDLLAPLPDAAPPMPAAPPFGVPLVRDIPPPFGAPPVPDMPTQVSPAPPFGAGLPANGRPGGATPPFGVGPQADGRPGGATPPFGVPPVTDLPPPFGAPSVPDMPTQLGPAAPPAPPAGPPPPPGHAAPPVGSTRPPVDYRGLLDPAPPAGPGAAAGSAPTGNGHHTRSGSAVDFARPSRDGTPTGFSAPLETVSPAGAAPQPSVSPLTTQSGALPPITALQAPAPSRQPATPTRPATGPDAHEDDTGRHASEEAAQNPDAPHRGRHSASPS